MTPEWEDAPEELVLRGFMSIGVAQNKSFASKDNDWNVLRGFMSIGVAQHPGRPVPDLRRYVLRGFMSIGVAQ